MIVGKIVPRISVLAVVFADRTPLPLAEVRSPLFPWDTRVTSVVQALLFRDVCDVLCRQGPLLQLGAFRRDVEATMPMHFLSGLLRPARLSKFHSVATSMGTAGLNGDFLKPRFGTRHPNVR